VWIEQIPRSAVRTKRKPNSEGSLTTDQQAALKDRVRKMDKVWSELAWRFETLDRDLAQTAPDAKLLASHAKELEKSLKKWQKQHRDLASEIGIQS
jgi:chromosome segregation ATPase